MSCCLPACMCGPGSTHLICLSCLTLRAALQAYRELLVTTPGLGQYISGAILFEETLFQDTRKGTSMVDELNKNVSGCGGTCWPGLTGAMHACAVPGARPTMKPCAQALAPP